MVKISWPSVSFARCVLAGLLLAISGTAATSNATEPTLLFDFENNLEGWTPGPGTARVPTAILGGNRAIYAEPSVSMEPPDPERDEDGWQRGYIERELVLTGVSRLELRQSCDGEDGCRLVTGRLVPAESDGMSNDLERAFALSFLPDGCIGPPSAALCSSNPDRSVALLPNLEGRWRLRIEWTAIDLPYNIWFGAGADPLEFPLAESEPTAGFIDEVAIYARSEVAPAAGWSVRQIADASSAALSIAGSRVAWADQSEIYLYHEGHTVQITDDERADGSPSVSKSLLAWESCDGDCYAFPQAGDWEIFVYDGSEVQRLTDNMGHDMAPTVYGDRVAWIGCASDCADGASELFLYDGAVVQQVTNDNVRDFAPVVLSAEEVLWLRCDLSCELVSYDGSAIETVFGPAQIHGAPAIDGSTVAWAAYDGADCMEGEGDYEIFVRRSGTTEQLTDNDINDVAPRVANERVAWIGCDRIDGCIDFFDNSVRQPRLGAWNAFLFDGVETRLLAADQEHETILGLSADFAFWTRGFTAGVGQLLVTGQEGTGLLAEDASSVATDDSSVVWVENGHIFLAPEPANPLTLAGSVIASFAVLIRLRARPSESPSRWG